MAFGGHKQTPAQAKHDILEENTSSILFNDTQIFQINLQ